MTTVQFMYTNHRGECRLRTIDVDGIEYRSQPMEEYGYEPGWFISGICQDKKARRTFALANIDVSNLNQHGNAVFAFYRMPNTESTDGTA